MLDAPSPVEIYDEDDTRVLSLWKGLIGDYPVTIRKIAERVAKERGISYAEMMGLNRSRRVAWPRQEAIYTAMMTRRWPSTVVGRAFHRDHSTIGHAVKAHAKRLADEAGMREA